MIYSIADLHLDYTKEKSMDIFGTKWVNYEEKIFDSWKNEIKEEDTILIPGDITWAMTLAHALYDLQRIDHLPGKKIMIRGNHDYWWSSISKIRSLDLKTIKFIQNDSIELNDVNICGTRGWIDPSHKEFKVDDERIFKRELLRCEMSLKSVKNDKDIIFMIHYPPFTSEKVPNAFESILLDYPVKIVNYGHLHAKGHVNIVEGTIRGIEYICSSSDYINFKPIKVRL